MFIRKCFVVIRYKAELMKKKTIETKGQLEMKKV